MSRNLSLENYYKIKSLIENKNVNLIIQKILKYTDNGFGVDIYIAENAKKNEYIPNNFSKKKLTKEEQEDEKIKYYEFSKYYIIKYHPNNTEIFIYKFNESTILYYSNYDKTYKTKTEFLQSLRVILEKKISEEEFNKNYIKNLEYDSLEDNLEEYQLENE